MSDDNTDYTNNDQDLSQLEVGINETMTTSEVDGSLIPTELSSIMRLN